jgi:hypothetical protein
VEHLCGYAQSDLVVPLLTEAQVSGVPVSVPAANTAAAAWCAEINAAVHSEIAAVPDERLAAECQLLAPLPSLRPEIGAASVKRKVDRLSCVRCGSARYSVPTRLIGASVNIVIVFEMLFQPLRAQGHTPAPARPTPSSPATRAVHCPSPSSDRPGPSAQAMAGNPVRHQ